MNRQRRKQQSQAREGVDDSLTPLEIWASFQEPMLRWGDVPGSKLLLGQRILHPEDRYLAELHARIHEDQLAKAVMSGDPFHGNPPPAGHLPLLQPGRIPIARLATGDVLSICVDDLMRNLMVCGPTGGGKTSWFRLMVAAVLAALGALVIAFDRKGGELVNCAALSQAGLPLLVLNYPELALAMLQPPAGVTVSFFSNVLVQLLASQLNLFASRRLLGDTLDILYNRPRPVGTWPLLAEWMAMIEAIRVSSLSRLGEYREAALYALKGLYRELGTVLNFASSNMLEQLFSRSGCVVVLTHGLGVEAESCLISLIINYAYLGRQDCDPDTLRPLIFLLDDALPLVRGSNALESEGGINPLANWAFMGRSRKMGLAVAAHNFSCISPALVNNTATTLCFGSYGRDAEELARYMNLTREQAAMLPVIQPGEVIAIARSVWPLAVHGFVPEVP